MFFSLWLVRTGSTSVLKEFTGGSQPHLCKLITHCFFLSQNLRWAHQIWANLPAMGSLSSSSDTNRPTFISPTRNEHCQYYLCNSQPGLMDKYIAELGTTVRVFNETQCEAPCRQPGLQELLSRRLGALFSCGCSKLSYRWKLEAGGCWREENGWEGRSEG